MALGIAVSGSFGRTERVSLTQGETREVLGYRLTYTGHTDEGARGATADIQVQRGQWSMIARPRMMESPRGDGMMHTPALDLAHDIYVAPVEIGGKPMESVSGGTHWGGGVLIHAEDQARIGTLMLRRGEWAGKRILPESWVEESLKPCPLNPNYGLLWWLNTGGGRHKSGPERGFYASGAGGNLTWVSPEQDLVAVMRWLDPSAADTFIRLTM